MAKIASGVALLVLVCASSSRPAKEITLDQARQLVLKTLEAETNFTKLPKFGLDHYSDPYFPGFFFFEATWDNPHQPPASVVLGHYAVNRKTAEVWESIGCRRLSPSAIRPLQKSLRKGIGLSKQECRKLSAIAPCLANS
jgi:hypothetical protein